ncbi:Leucine-rich repeat receptor-like protein kinase, partial [Musa troglodytarum]
NHLIYYDFKIPLLVASVLYKEGNQKNDGVNALESMSLQLRHLVLVVLTLDFWSSCVAADTLPDEALALYSLASKWQASPRNWEGSDPCGSNWVGIYCSNSHITSIVLSGLSISGSLSEEIQNLTELVHLDLSFNPGLDGPIPRTIGNLVKLKRLFLVGCSFSGSIPPELGKLSRLAFLSLNSNKLSGSIPGELGNLSSLVWFDITDNEISGSIPVSDGTNLGLDMLKKCQHFHFGRNNLSGPIPPELFQSNSSLLHVLFDTNKLTGSIPETIGVVHTLEALRLDRNQLTGAVPSNFNNLTKLAELQLSNNQLSGPLPNLTGMDELAYVDLSNNSFDVSDVPPWFSTLPSLTTLMLEFLKVSGQIPASLFGFPQMQKARLRSNLINGTLDLGSQYSKQLTLVDVRDNRIQDLYYGGYPNELLLERNPYCDQQGSVSKYCDVAQQSNPATTYSTPMQNCGASVCPSDQEMSSNCICSYPYEGTIVFRFLTFSNTENYTYYQTLEQHLYQSFQDNKVPVGFLSLQNPKINLYNYFQLDMWMFPSSKGHFDEPEVVLLANLFSSNTFNSPPGFGPYYFIPKPYPSFPESGSKSKNAGLIAGVTVGGLLLASVVAGLIIFAIRRRRKVKKATEQSLPSGSWNPSQSGSGVPQLKGSRLFSFEELTKYTHNFSEANVLGTGSYGKVYRGALDDGQLIAVKRAQQGSLQGDHEFKTEIEMLSRVHHRNLVSLVGFCFDHSEQILVYEYIPNGSLRDSLSGNSGVYLDWKKRLRITLGAARGLTYLHELANPRIIHRDVKSNNILLDHQLNAKVSDFGLCKPLSDDFRGYISTQVKGTMGYLDPEYYMTQHLTEKSDVYSFGVLLLELVTARKPIERGRFIVREVRNAINKSPDLHDLRELLDPAICMNSTLPGLDRFMELAMKCVEESSADRPWMSDVAKEIENIMVLAGMNPYIASESNSASFGGERRSHPYESDVSFDYSGGPYSPKVVPK